MARSALYWRRFIFARRYLSWAVLWTPLPFYVLCIAWGSVPVYHPEWWPFSYYNVDTDCNYCQQLLVFAALGCEFLTNFFRPRYVVAAAALVIAASYYFRLENDADLPAGGPNQWQGTRGAGAAACGNDASPSAFGNVHDELRGASRCYSDGRNPSPPGSV